MGEYWSDLKICKEIVSIRKDNTQLLSLQGGRQWDNISSDALLSFAYAVRKIQYKLISWVLHMQTVT